MNEYSSIKELLQKDWRWVVGVSLLLALPAYGLMPAGYAVITHFLTTLAYVGLLRTFGPGFVIEGALFVLPLATLLGLTGPTMRLWEKHHPASQPAQTQGQQSLPAK